VVAVREPGHVADVGEDPGSAGRADTVDAHKARAGGGDVGFELGFHRLELGVQAVQVFQFFGGHAAAGLTRQIARADRGQQRPVLAGGLFHRRTARDQVQEQPVQPVEGLGPGAGELIAAAAASAARPGPD
jgi:hypothetical protein